MITSTTQILIAMIIYMSVVIAIGIIFAKKEQCMQCFAVLVTFVTLFSAFQTKTFFNIDFKLVARIDFIRIAFKSKQTDINCVSIEYSCK